jgi:hypothetical protein
MSAPVTFETRFGIRICSADTLQRMAAWVHSYAVKPAAWSTPDRGFLSVTSWEQVRDHMAWAPDLPKSLLFQDHWHAITWPMFLLADKPGRALLLSGEIEDQSADDNSREYEGPYPWLAALDTPERLDDFCGVNAPGTWALWLCAPDFPPKYLARALGGLTP